MKYQLTRIADSDLLEIWRYTAKKWGKKQANQYLKELESCFINLTQNPELGRLRPEIKEGYLSVNHHKHLIFYRHHQHSIQIIRVLHQRMEIKLHL